MVDSMMDNIINPEDAAGQSGQFIKEKNYWLDKLTGHLLKSIFPYDHKHVAPDKRGMDSLEFAFTGDIYSKLMKLSNNSDIRLHIILTTTLSLLISKYSHSKDITVGMPIYKQDEDGEYINTLLALRNTVNPHITFKEFLMQVSRTISQAVEHQNYPIDTLAHKLGMSFSREDDFPLFDVVLLLENIHYKKYIRGINLNMIFHFKRNAEYIHCHLEYNAFRYEKETVQGIIAHLVRLQEEAFTHLDAKLADIDLVSSVEKERLLSQLNDTRVEYPAQQTIHALFEDQVEKNPAQTALIHGNDSTTEQEIVSYEELNQRANILARLLRNRGVKPDFIVAIMVKPGVELITAILGVLKAGGAYLPLEPGTPQNRILSILEDSRAAFLLTTTQSVKEHPFPLLVGLQEIRREPFRTPPRQQIKDFDSLPIPNRSLVDYERCNLFIGHAMVKDSISIQGTRGCPYLCAYCHKIWPKSHVIRSAENIFEEVLLYYNMGVRRFEFIDDIFNLNKKNSSRFFQMVINNGLDAQFFFPNGVRGDILTEDYIDLMVEAGLTGIALALETASPRLQKLIKKNLNIDKLHKNLEYFCSKHPQVILELFTMHGFPSETEEEAMMTLNFIRSMKWIHFPYINILKIYSNTEMEELALAHGIEKEAILRSENLAHHQLSTTLPFEKGFTLKYQSEFFNGYFLSKERLLKVMPHQLRVLTEDEIVQKYNSYLPTSIYSLEDLLNFLGIQKEELAVKECVEKGSMTVPDLNTKMRAAFEVITPNEDAYRILLLDLSQSFSQEGHRLNDLVEPPLGLMYLATYLNRELGPKVNCKIAKSLIDFDNYDQLKTLLEEFNPHLIAIRTLIFYKDFFHRTVFMIRQWGVDTPIITGGPYASSSYNTILQDKNIQLVVLGEGEITFTQLIRKTLENNGALPGEAVLREIDGLAFIPNWLASEHLSVREIITLDALEPPHPGKPAPNPEPVNRPHHLAYIIYTSGSTGKPKGVMVEHQGLVNYTWWAAANYVKNETLPFPLYTTITFDLTVTSVFTPLITGNHIIIYDDDDSGLVIERIIEENRVGIVKLTPSHLKLIRDKKNTGSRIKRFVVGGEELYTRLANDIHDNFNSNIEIYNEYGPTEAVVGCMVHRFDPREDRRASVPIGGPTANVRIYILDESLKPLPAGVAGEIFISGDGIARGYLNHPELTAEKFGHNKKLLRGVQGGGFLEKSPPGRRRQRIYQTGDLARLQPDGKIQFLGRRDDQVKIRGYRIELGEIKNILLNHKHVDNAAVVIKYMGENADPNLIAYFSARQELTISQLRSYLEEHVPDYMIPTYFVPLEQLPLTPAGKIDRQALPDPGGRGLASGVEYVAPRSPIEEQMMEIWASVLGRSKVSINENFFMIGGDSIKSIQIISRMSKAGYKIKMKELFRYSSIAELAPHVKESREKSDQAAVSGNVPLTPIQQWFFREHSADKNHNNLAAMFYEPGGFNEATVKAVLVKILEHHDALRITFKEEQGGILQTCHGLDFPTWFEQYDLGDTDRPPAALQQKAGEIQASFNLEEGPLMKTALFHLPDGDRLLITVHHLVIDVVSWRILLEDIETLYQQHKKGEPLVLPAKTDSYKHWAEKLCQYANSESFLKEKQYWRQVTTVDVPPLEKNFDHEENLSKDAKNLSFRLSDDETQLLLTRVHQAFGTEINSILLTALGLAFKNVFGNTRLLVELEGHGREEIIKDIDINRTIGWFTSLFPLLLDISYDDNLSRQIREIKESLQQVPENGVGYGILKYLTHPDNKQGMDFNIDPQVGFNYLGQFDTDLQQVSFNMAKESTGSLVGKNGKRDHLLDITGMILGKQLVMTIIYNENQYETATIEALKEQYSAALSRIITFCTARQERTRTPADFTYMSFSIDELDAIEASVDEEIEDIYPLSPMQEGMMLHALHKSTSTAYFEQLSYRLQGELDRLLLEKSFNALIQRYDILRTAFIYENLHRPLQVLLKERQMEFYYEDLTSADRQNVLDKEAYIAGFREKDRLRSFDLAHDVLMRVTIFKLGSDTYEFTWSFHHILLDGWSKGVVQSDFFHIYNCFRENKPFKLPLVKPYRIYIEWLEQRDREKSRDYWKAYLEDCIQPTMVPGKLLPQQYDAQFRKEEESIVLDPEQTDGLIRLAAKYNVTFNTLVQALWGIILGHYKGAQDTIFGTVVSGRSIEVEGMEAMVGLFINSIPVRIRYDERTTFKDLLIGIQEDALESEPHQYFPLASIQSLSPLKQQLLDHLLVFENYPISSHLKEAVQGDGETRALSLEITGVETFEHTSYDFGVIVFPGKQLEITLDYNSAVYDTQWMEVIAGHFRHLLAGIAREEPGIVAELDILPAEEKRRILEDFNRTDADYPGGKTLHCLFEEQVQKTPDCTALVYENEPVTYLELNRRANRLARQLRQEGVSPGVTAALLLETSIDLATAVFGVLKAGGNFLPLDTGYPKQRIKYMLQNSEVKILLHDGTLAADPEDAAINRRINIAGESLAWQEDGNPVYEIEPGTAAYIIYTSGTTGKPKGVVVEHRNIVNTLTARKAQYAMDREHVALQLFSFSFDGFMTSFFTPLISGSTLILTAPGDLIDIDKLSAHITGHGVTHFISIPALYRAIINHLTPQQAGSLLVITLAGDAIAPELLKLTAEKNPGIEIVNEYGVTECAVMSTIYRHQERNAVVKIGQPTANTRIYILDYHDRLVPIGVRGQLCISGSGVARGYHNNRELTDHHFSPDPFCDGQRMYRSGDAARWLPDGNIQLLGRMDHQVKIRGFRIETGEIENQLILHPDIDEAVVIVREEKLCAYVVPNTAAQVSLDGLHDYLANVLPKYMIPAHFFQLENIPLTSTGKVDRRALAASGIQLEPAARYVAPGNEMEHTIITIWKELLNLDKVGVHDNFFQLGGDSLKVIPLNKKLRDAFNRDIPVAALYEHMTVSSLVGYLTGENPGEAAREAEREKTIAKARQSMKKQKARRKLYD